MHRIPSTTRHRGRLWALTLVLVVVGAACSSGDTDATTVRPFSDIQSSDLRFGLDDRGLGEMVVETSAAAVCSIAWGETEALGNLNTDLDMAGTGHTEHHVVLPGAEPGKTYFYRLQGTTADGSLFQSELQTFTLPEAEASAPGTERVNLAEGATVLEVSSEFSPAWAGANAVDGDLSTEWATSGSGDDAYIVIDLGEERAVSGVEFLTRSMSDGSATTTEFTVTVDDGETFGPFPASAPGSPQVATLETTGRVFGFDVAASTGGNTGAIEVMVYASR